MKTNKCISTISYNSEKFLQNLLNELMEQQLIVFWVYVVHRPEHLEDGTMEKPHIHLFVEPHTQIDTLWLSKISCEFDPKHPDLPLKCIWWQKSDWNNWLWYDLHDEQYLKLKLEKREYSYTYEDFVSSDDAEFFERYNNARHSSTIATMLRLPRMMQEMSIAEMAYKGYIRPEQAVQFREYEKLCKRGKAFSMFEDEDGNYHFTDEDLEQFLTFKRKQKHD